MNALVMIKLQEVLWDAFCYFEILQVIQHHSKASLTPTFFLSAYEL